ncbi:MAG: GntR family transcriptional regulator [Silicimonas sp.]
MAGSGSLSKFDKALMGLRSLVLSGEYPSNARLSEVALSGRLGISRTPLRQAMDHLVGEGLLERIETGGCRVARFTVEDIEDAIELRGVIEGTAARLAAERGANPEKLRQAAELLDGIDGALAAPEGIDFDSYVAFNARFHAKLAELSGSATVCREVARVNRLPLASPSAFLNEQELIPDFQASLTIAQSQHRAILDAISRGEGARAEGLAREHARLARRNLEYVASKKSSFEGRLPGLALVETN